MISDVIRELLQEKDCDRKYFFYCLCFKWKNEKIVVSARDDEKYFVRKYAVKDYKSIDDLAEAVESDYVIPMLDNFGLV